MRVRVVGVAIGAALFCGGAAFASVSGLYNGFPVVKVLVNGKEVTGDVPAIVLDGRALVPLRLVAESLNADVVYDPVNRTVSIKKAEEKPSGDRPYQYEDEVTVGDLRVKIHSLSYANTVGSFTSGDNEKIAILDFSVYAQKVPSGAVFPKGIDVLSRWILTDGKEKNTSFVGSSGSPWLKKGEWVRVEALTTIDSQVFVSAVEVSDLTAGGTRLVVQLPRQP
ncbi:MAG: copper amine oxidase N-terminal domain-containing protein [Bacillota bacterium]